MLFNRNPLLRILSNLMFIIVIIILISIITTYSSNILSENKYTDSIEITRFMGDKNSTIYTERNERGRKFVFIDLGARNGDTIDWFIETYPKRLNNCVIYAFEANPKNTEDLVQYKIAHPELDINLIHKAVWIHSNGINFTVDNRPKKKVAGSIFSTIRQQRLFGMQSVFVQSVDISKWISEHVLLEQELVLKMDIEGAEFQVIDKMIEDESITLVDTFVVDWHQRFFRQKNMTADVYEDRIKQYNIEIFGLYKAYRHD